MPKMVSGTDVCVAREFCCLIAGDNRFYGRGKSEVSFATYLDETLELLSKRYVVPSIEYMAACALTKEFRDPKKLLEKRGGFLKISERYKHVKVAVIAEWDSACHFYDCNVFVEIDKPFPMYHWLGGEAEAA